MPRSARFSEQRPASARRLNPSSSTTLKQSQHWLQSAIIAPAARQSDVHIAPSARLTPAQHLEIYRELYPARLVAALKLDYPLLCQYLGAPVFTQLALLYAQAHPSTSFTLNTFGAKLPEFLAEIQGLRRAAFAIDLAVFERACSQVFHETQAAPLTPEAIAAVPPQAWHSAHLQPVPALRLLALRYPVHRYAEGETRIPLRDTYLAVYRHNYQIAWLLLTPTAFAVLQALVDGAPLNQALGSKRGPVQRWFSQWTAAGLFQSLSTPNSAGGRVL